MGLLKIAFSTTWQHKRWLRQLFRYWATRLKL